MSRRTQQRLVEALYITNLLVILTVAIFLMADTLQAAAGTFQQGTEAVSEGQLAPGESVLENVDPLYPGEVW